MKQDPAMEPLSSPPSPLCRLPSSLRGRIFGHAGVCNGAHFGLNRRRSRMGTSWIPYSATNLQAILPLFRVCRLINEEVTQMFYEHNTFLVRLDAADGLSALRALRPSTIARITTLRMETVEAFFHDKSRVITRVPSDLLAPSFALAEWTDALRYLLRHASLQVLRLGLICEMGDLDIARSSVAPLFEISGMADCAIQLATRKDPDLTALAKHAARHAMGLVSPISHFPFLALPLELQLQVLRYTDLITDFQEVEWQPGRGYWTVRQACPHRRKHSAMASDDPWTDKRHLYQLDDNLEATWSAIYCPKRFSAYSKHCCCWHPPTALFLVCPAMHAQVEQVFFTHNKFTLMPPDYHEEINYTPPTLEASRFFRQSTPLRGMSYLRFLEIVFPPFDNDFLQISGGGYHDWIELIHMLGVRISGLTLKISFAEVGPPPNIFEFGVNSGPTWRLDVNEERRKSIIGAYERIIKPLATLDGLRNLFVTVVMPQRYEDRLREQPGQRQLEKALEKQVMGDEYDSDRAGKHSMRPSYWVRMPNYTCFY